MTRNFGKVIGHDAPLDTSIVGDSRGISIMPRILLEESDSMFVPDNADDDCFRHEAVERILDQLDCSYSSKALPKGDSLDMEYKACIINVSQNVDRNLESTPSEICLCLTTSGILFPTSRGGLLNPERNPRPARSAAGRDHIHD